MSDIETNPTDCLNMASVERVTKKTVAKRVREFEVVVSDRVSLVEAANVFVGHIVTKQVMPVLASGPIATEIPMSDQETKTYNSALQFLQRQFEQGYSTTEPVEKLIETEQTEEFS
ncbi:MAG: hypothetical protein K9M08_08520 [Pirellula sp.]|nr:hypothetical protein [Pirellula sp.]